MAEPALALIADDDPMMRLLLRQTLEEAGMRVVEAEDGEAAVRAFDESSPAVVLLDVMMPGMDGFAACAALRARPGGEHAPVMMLTGLDDIQSIQQAYEAGATDFMSKPINWLVLSHRVRYMLRARAAMQALRESQARLAEAQRIAHLGSWRWHAGTGEVVCSPGTRLLVGLASDAAPLSLDSLHARAHPDDAAFVARSTQEAIRERTSYCIEYRLSSTREAERVLQERAEPFVDQTGAFGGLRGTVQDITNLHRAEERIRYLAHHDPVTQLPNRLLFHERVEQALRHANKHGHGAAVMMLDLDNFKLVNDTFGPVAADGLLCAVGTRVREVIQGGRDFATKLGPGEFDLARFGGDDFAVLLAEISQPDDAARVARRLIESFRRPFQIGDQETFLSLSAGIAAYPTDGSTPEELLKNAESGLFHAKEQGRGTFQFYAPAMNTRALERLTLETQLRKALERDEFVLHYQPQVDLRSGLVGGVEALVRWQHPDLGLVPPGHFIPVAEASGLILPLGDWVLRKACEDCARWADAGLESPVVSVNVSSHSFQQAGFYDCVLDALTQARLEPAKLALELTETVLMRDAATTDATLRRLADIGVRLSVDDFGTGYSSLAYLKRFPLHALKIDRSFIQDLSHDPDDASIVIAIIQMARGLGLSVIAEGVETEDQLAFLRGRECDVVQGWIFSRAEPFEHITQLLRAGARMTPARLSKPAGLRVVRASSPALDRHAPDPVSGHGAQG